METMLVNFKLVLNFKLISIFLLVFLSLALNQLMQAGFHFGLKLAQLTSGT